MNRALVLTCMMLLAPEWAQAQDFSAVDAVVEPHIGDDAPGLAVLVMLDGDVLLARGYGLADLDSETPVDEHTLFDLASLSKQMTGLATMLLIEDGVLSEDTPVDEVLPAFAGQQTDYRSLLVRDLVHHLSGLPDYLNDDDFAYADETTNAEVVDWLAGAPRDRAPGTAFDYSNSGYLTLASLVAAADGAESLSDVLHERVWDALGMDETGLVTPTDPDALATGYAGTGGDFVEASEPTVTEGDGNVFTSIADLAKYEAAISGHELLGATATGALFSNAMLDDGTPLTQDDGAGYGFGWNLDTMDGERIAYHDGSWYGTATAYLRNLDSGLTVILLSNGEDLGAMELAEEIAAVVQDD